jgi:hypothetical protein
MIDRPRSVRVSVENFHTDPMFPRVERAVAAILVRGKVVAPVDVLVGMGMLRPEDLESWRSGRVQYLESVVQGSLSRLSRLLRILGFHCHDLKLSASQAAYVRLGSSACSPGSATGGRAWRCGRRLAGRGRTSARTRPSTGSSSAFATSRRASSVG